MKRAALLAAVTVVAYLPSLVGPFQFDDYNVIVNGTTVGGIRPVLKASYALNWMLDAAPFGFHLFNIALHALNAVLLFLIGTRIRGQVPNAAPVAFVAALLFALHPMQTEAVTYVSGRSSSLMAAFYLSALLAYLANRPWPLSALLFALALATRETAVTLPAALLLVELCRGTPWRTIARRQAAHWLLLAGAGAVVLFNARYFELLAYGFGSRSLVDNLLTQIGGVSYLVWHLVSLQDLNIDPALPTLHGWSPTLLLQFLLLCVLFALGVANLRRRPWLAFGILWFFLHLAPTNSLVPRLDVANDRQVYLACWGLFFALCVQLAAVPPVMVRTAAATLCILLAGASILRQADYASEIALWEASVRSSPWNARAHNNLGYAYYEAGRKPEARREIRTALRLDPAMEKARANLVLLDWR